MLDPIIAQLITARLRKRLSQSEIGRRMGVSPSFVNRLESGTRGAKTSTVNRYAAALDMTWTLRRKVNRRPSADALSL